MVCRTGERASQHRRTRGRHQASGASRRRACRCRRRAVATPNVSMQSSIARRPCVDDVEEGVRVERGADVHARAARAARAGTAPPPPSMAKSDAQRRPALAAEREPRDVRLLHPRRVADDPLPPVRSRSARGAARVRMDEDDRSCRRRRVERRPTRDRSPMSADEPSETPTKPSRTLRRRERQEAVPPRARTEFARPSIHAPSSASRSAPASSSRARLGCSESTATSIPSRSSASKARVRGRARARSTAKRPSRVSSTSPSSRGGGVARAARRRTPPARGAGARRTSSSCGSRAGANRRCELFERERHRARASRGTGCAHARMHGSSLLRCRASRRRGGRSPATRPRARRDEACAEVEHLREPPRSQRAERAVRSSTPDSCMVEASSTRDGLGEEPRLGRDRLRRDTELREPVLPRALVRDESLGQAAESRAQELQRSLDRRC